MLRDTEEWQRPWVDDAPATGHDDDRAGGEVAQPASPQLPPAGWTAEHVGPGSPAGSVRPPDTTGVVEVPRPARRRGVVATLVAALLGGAVGTVGTLTAVGAWPGSADGPAVPASTPAVAPGGSDRASGSGPVASGSGGAPTDVVAVARAVTPSVVRIDVAQGAGPVLDAGRSGIGSGVVYREDGYIITNHHVVEGARTVEVKFADGEVLDAEVIGSDPLNDLAIVQVDRTDLTAVRLRRDPPLQVGEMAVAIGSPFGLEASVTAGVISALNRELSVPGEDGVLLIPAVVQTDAAINPGNSGGALVDGAGRLVGINTAILTGSGGSQGVGFAIPTASAVATADELIEKGFVEHPFLGIGGSDLTPEMAERIGLDAPRGAVVDQVIEGSGAARAGIREGDVILAIDGAPVDDMTDLIVEIRRFDPGRTITLTIVRDGRRIEEDVELGERPR